MDTTRTLPFATDPQTVDLAGRQRMLNQRLIKECLAQCLCGQTDTAQYQATENLLRTTAAALARGGPVTMIPGQAPAHRLRAPATDAIRLKLEEQLRLAGHVAEAAAKLLECASEQGTYAAPLAELLQAGDEFHQVADAGVKLLSRHFQQTQAALEEAERALTSTMDSVIRVINTQSEELVESSERLAANSRIVAQGAQSTSEHARAVSDASMRVGEGVQKVATATEQMSGSIREIGLNTSESEQQAVAAAEHVSQAGKAMLELGQSSTRIAEITGFIQEVARYTNLLALNAKIEAARAGEAGLGFAVVADEVRELAKQTTQAASDIEERVEVIQRDVAYAHDTISKLRPVVQTFKRTSSTIATNVRSHEQATREIADQLGVAAVDLGDIANGIEEVARTAARVAVSAVDSDEAVGALERLARRLRAVAAKVYGDEELSAESTRHPPLGSTD